MKRSIIALFVCSATYFLAQTSAFASPGGDILIYNASKNNVTAQVSAFGKFTLASNQSKSVSYSMLSQACSSSPTNCRAQFYVNNVPAGSATINVVTGKLVHMNISSVKVSTGKGAKSVLRSVVIK